jgi:multidrug efflux pump subunit AcrA (membrane-fusion protein)
MLRKLLLCALPVCLVAAVGCAPKPTTSTKGEEPKTVAVTVAESKSQPIRRTVPIVGSLYPYEDVTLAPKVSGKVIRALRDVGDRVGPGEPLLELDSTEYQLAVDQAKPAFEAELRKLKITKLPLTDTEFEKHLPQVDIVSEARANVELADSELKRIQNEFDRGVGSKQALESGMNRLAVAKARLAVAETEARVTLANARRLKAILNDAERRLADTKLNAPSPQDWDEWVKLLGPTTTPLKYAVAQKMVSIGEMVQSMPITNCYRLVIDHVLKLGAPVPEVYAPEIVLGQTVEIRVKAFPARVFTGTVVRISPTVDATTRAFAVVIAVMNNDGKLKAGSFATAEILLRSENVVTIPPEALAQFAGVNKVFVMEGDKAKAVEVTVGTREPEWIEVTGIPAGAKVITSGQSQLVDGSLVRLR